MSVLLVESWSVNESSVGPSRAALQEESSTETKAKLEDIPGDPTYDDNPDESWIISNDWIFTQ